MNDIITIDNDNVSDKSEKLSTISEKREKSSKSSKSSKARSPKPIGDSVKSFSIGQMDYMINNDKVANSQVKNVTDVHEKHEKSTHSEKEDRQKYKKDKKAYKENKDPQVLEKKNEILYKLDKIYPKHTCTTANTLEELESEYIRRNRTIDSTNGVNFIKKMTLLAVHGLEAANQLVGTEYCDIIGFNESLSYSFESSKEWDTTLEELYEKFKTSSNIEPEYKFMFMLIYSSFMFSVTKKAMNTTKPQKARKDSSVSLDDLTSKMQEPMGESENLEFIINKMKANEQQAPKKRGRPPKKNVEEHIQLG